MQPGINSLNRAASRTIIVSEELRAEPWCTPIFSSNSSLFSLFIHTVVTSTYIAFITLRTTPPLLLQERTTKQPYAVLDQRLSSCPQNSATMVKENCIISRAFSLVNFFSNNLFYSFTTPSIISYPLQDPNITLSFINTQHSA